MTSLATPAVSVVTLAGLALVLSINNVIPVATLTARARSPREGFLMRLGGLAIGLAARLALVTILAVSLRPEFEDLFGLSIPDGVRTGLLFGAGGFLLANAALEMKRRLSKPPVTTAATRAPASPLGILRGIVLVAVADISLAFDSLVVVAGMAPGPITMAAIVILEVLVILIFSESIAALLRRYPTIETLAICALLLMGLHMVLRGAGILIPEPVIYAMIGFALIVELIDMRIATLHHRE